MEFQTVMITPEMAKDFLQKNPKENRTIRKATVEQYANDIKAGKWFMTPEAISFDVDGKLSNGQHRLSAIVEAGIPVEMVVATGCPKESSRVIDSGLARSTADRIKFGGYDPLYYDNHVIAFIRAVNFTDFGVSRYKKFSDSEIVEQIERYSGACEFVKKPSNTKCSRAGIAVSIVAAMCKEPVESVINFVKCINNNEIVEGSTKYNYKAALDFAMDVNSRLPRGGVGGTIAIRQSAERAIYCFCNDVKRTNKEYPIYPITKEQLANFNADGI